ncbi:transposase [Bryobacterales bacterium F-183]|nr:transposase [Bryobacterales bacterium F-183]
MVPDTVPGTPRKILGKNPATSRETFATLSPLTLQMPRKPRFAPAGYYLHLTQRGNYRQTTFHCDLDHHMFQQILTERAEANRIQVLAYCHMPNHYHLIARSQDPGGIPAFMRGLNGQYARYLHGRLVRRGRLWQDRYYSSVLSTAHLIRAMRYVELNPVRANFVPFAADYAWSSARLHCGITAPENELICMDHETFAYYYPTQHLWREFLQAGETRHEISAIRHALRAELPLGDAAFVEELKARFPSEFDGKLALAQAA